MPVSLVVMVALVELPTVTLINVSVHQDIQDSIAQHVSYLFLLKNEMCENIGDPCADNPCLNGGACMSNGFAGFTCQCPPGYSGQRCEDRKEYGVVF